MALGATILSPIEQAETKSLLELSARLGSDPMLVQAGSGNTSVKLNDVLWIKASGKWLADATCDEILVPVNLTEVRRCLELDHEVECQYTTASGNQLRSSIETAMHAVLPHRVVIHVHSVNAIAWAVQQNGPDRCHELLAGLRWQWIRYVPSGLPLAREIQLALKRNPDRDIFILANHGLVVCGDTCACAEALLYEIEARLAVAPRAAAEPDCAILRKMCEHSAWCLPANSALHALGTDPVSVRILSGGTLYPCQAIFLAVEAPLARCLEHIPDASTSYCKAFGFEPPFFVIEGIGILVSDRMTRAQFATLFGLVNVIQRISGPSNIAYLPQADVREVLSTDAYGYRALVEKNHTAEVLSRGALGRLAHSAIARA